MSSKVWGNSPRVGSNKPNRVNWDHLTVPSVRHHSFRRSLDGSASNSSRIGHPSSMGDISSSRGRGPLRLENLQDSLHVSPEEVHFSLNLGKGLADSSIVGFVFGHVL